MARDRKSEKHPGRLQQLGRLLTLNIRTKIVLPYLILTLSVAIVGTYVVTRLVASSLDERLTNQLLEAGRVVSDSLARQEMDHLRSARTIAFTAGLAEAVQAGDRDQVDALTKPAAALQGVEALIIVDANGQEMVDMLPHDDGSSEFMEGQFDTSGLWMVQTLLEAGDPNGLPRRGLVNQPVDQRYYYLTAIPIGLENRMVGAVVVGTSLDTLLPYFKTTSRADVIIYLDGGRAVASTFTVAEQDPDKMALLDELSTTPALYESALHSTGSTTGENVRIRGRSYRLARAPLRVGDDAFGVFAVALPSHFIVQAGATSRNTYALIFSTAMAAVILVGYLISQRITLPLSRLVRTSQAVTDGDLSQRTGIVSTDEIGMLAATFDEMTGQLSERTQALVEETEKTRSILSSISDGVIVLDLQGKVMRMNQSAETMMGSLASVSGEDPIQKLRSELSLDKPTPTLTGRTRIESGGQVIEALSSPVRTSNDELLGTVIAVRDITDTIRATQMAASISHLEERDMQKTEMISIASHELRSPLTSAKTFIQNLLDGVYGKLSDDQAHRLKIVLDRVNDEIQMVNSLLDFSRLEAQPRPLILEPADIAAIARGIVQEFKPRAERKEITLSTGPLQTETVLIDERKIWRVLSNLLDNALKFTPSGGQVTLSAESKDKVVEIQVADTGIGMPTDQLERIFDKFYQLDSSTTREFGGMGLGLAIAKEIVEMHGGTIWAESQPGTGSVFHFTLPKAPI